MSANVGSMPRYLITAVGTYLIASYGSYKYSLITKAQEELRDVKDQKVFLKNKHDEIAENYDSLNEKRDFSNKYGRYRKTLLSYAEGRVLEMGIGTGVNLQYYGPRVKELVGVDWSDNMLMKAFGRYDDVRADPEYKGPDKVKLVRGDCL